MGDGDGGEKFSPDANEVMQLLLASQVKGEEMAEDDPQMFPSNFFSSPSSTLDRSTPVGKEWFCDLCHGMVH